jgi:hypothetical protein
MDVQTSQFQVSRSKAGDGSEPNTFTLDPKAVKESMDASALAYQYEVAKACGIALEKRILSFNDKQPTASKEDHKAKYNRPLRANTSSQSAKRLIPTAAER